MTRHYSSRNYFRNTPNACLARYVARNVLQDFDFTAIEETKIDPLFDAWMLLSEAQRSALEAELIDLDQMSNEKGTKAIIEEAEYHLD